MNAGKILITGATGDTGGYAIEQLLQKGHEVRALVHRIDDRSRRFDDKGVEVVAGDYLDLGAMRTAVKGVRRAYFVYPIRPGIIQATAYFAQAAREAGVEAIANMSQISAREDARSHAARDHWVAERVFDWSGIAVAHLRPTFFAEWLLYNAPMIKAGTLAMPFGAGSTRRSRPRTRPALSWGSLRTRLPTAARSTRCTGRRSTRQPRSHRS